MKRTNRSILKILVTIVFFLLTASCDFTCVRKEAAPVCGNGVPEAGEQCDDGNANCGDGCCNCAVE